MSDTVEDADDGAVVPGVPPGPSVTPGSAPPPPSGAEPEPPSPRGCLLVGIGLALAALVALAVVVVAIGIAAGWFEGVDDEAEARDIVTETGIETRTPDLDHPPQRDIRLGACEVTDDGDLRASGTLTNWTSEPADYRIEISFLDGDGSARSTEVGATTVTVDELDVHATTNWSGEVASTSPASLTCRIVRVDRWPSGEQPPGDG